MRPRPVPQVGGYPSELRAQERRGTQLQLPEGYGAKSAVAKGDRGAGLLGSRS